MILDVCRFAWLAVVLWVFTRAFGAGRRGVGGDPAARIALAARVIIVIVLAINVLARIHSLNAVTLFAACFAWPCARCLKRFRWSPDRAARSLIRTWVLASVRRVEQSDLSSPIARLVQRRRRYVVRQAALARSAIEQRSTGGVVLAAAAAAALVAAAYVHLGSVPGEVRLQDPRLYGIVL